MRDERQKYTLDYIVENMEEDWIAENPDTALDLIQWMKSELDRRKNVIKILQNTIEDIL